MASAIDPTLPVQGNPTTASVRANFSAAKSEIEALQATAGVGPKGDTGPQGPSGTLTVGTVTTGAAGTNAAVTNSGTTQAAVLNFTLPRGDSGTGGSGITETQAKDAVRQGNVRFEESPETTAPAWATTPNLAGVPTMGAGWTGVATPTATTAYTHAIGSTEPLAYPATIGNGTFYQILFTMTNVAATSTALSGFFTIYFRTAPTVTTGQQTILASVSASNTIVIEATGSFSHLVIVPVTGWQGNFTLTRIVAWSGNQNTATLSVKDWVERVRDTSAYIGGGGKFATGGQNIGLGRGTLDLLASGSNNVAVGNNALSRSTTASGNVAVGNNAMGTSMTGSSNVAIGSASMQLSQTASSCVAIGNGPMQENIGSNNIAIGSYTLYYVSGVYNVAIGDWSGFRGANNTGIGYRCFAPTTAGPTPPSGSNNTGLGYFAGSYYGSGSNLGTTDNSVFLGANTKPAANSETNQIVIGYNALGHGSNTITLGNDAITALHCHVQTISALSDSRVKENIQHADLNKCLTAVKNLPVSEWDWLPIAGPHPDKHDIGFVSDDVAKVFPKAITKEDRFLTLRDAQGNPEMTTVTEAGAPWTPPPDAGPVPASTQTRQIEKTMEIKGLQYVSTSEMLPTLWGAVQQLIQRIEQLEKPADNPGGNPSTESKGGFFRGKKQ